MREISISNVNLPNQIRYPRAKYIYLEKKYLFDSRLFHVEKRLFLLTRKAEQFIKNNSYKYILNQGWIPKAH